MYRKSKRRSAKEKGLCDRIAGHSICLPLQRFDLALRRNIWTIAIALLVLYWGYLGVWLVYTGASLQKYYNLPVAEQLLQVPTLVGKTGKGWIVHGFYFAASCTAISCVAFFSRLHCLERS